MQKKHRLIFLVTVLVGLILFYFGVDTWMKQKQVKENQPPPIVLKPVAPVKPKTQTSEKKAQEKKVELSQTAKKEVKQEEKKKEEAKGTEEKKKQIVKREVKQKKQGKKVETAKKVSKTKRKVVKTKIYKFQVGAFRYRENAYKMVKIVRRKGFNAKIVKAGSLYRVYAYVEAENYWQAKRRIRKYFKDAIFVRK